VTKVLFRHETPAAARDRGGGTGVAFTSAVIGVYPPVRRVREAGVTLLEALIVLAIIALVTAIVTVPVNSYWQRSRLETTAGDVRNFLQQAYIEAVDQHAPMTVTMQQLSGKWVLRIAPPPLHAPATFTLPDFVSLALNPSAAAGGWPAVGATRELICDTVGRTLDPTTGPPPLQVTSTRTLAITHVRMLDGSLTPYLRFDIQVYPLWNVSFVKVVV
jgi:type II secretory pathway pseudopilin PulG